LISEFFSQLTSNAADKVRQTMKYLLIRMTQQAPDAHRPN
jgi:hypothetical protein